jgi:hypothetical protein
LLVFLVAFQVFLKIAVVGYFNVNRDFITANFCENRNKPEMHCNGKCYLKKQLQKANESEGQRAPSQKVQSEIQPFIFEESKNHFAFLSTQVKSHLGEPNIHSGFISALLRPPKV